MNPVSMNAPSLSFLDLSISTDGILSLTLNRPDAANALSVALMGDMQKALTHASSDSQVRVVVIRAAGSNFCAGHDLKEMTAVRSQADGGHEFFDALFMQCAHLMQTIARYPKPVIAQVKGMATAAGCQLVASCDMALADEDARFATPGVDIGLFCSTPAVALSRNVSRKHAMEMLLTGEPISATRAYEIGLINKVTKPTTLEEETRQLAHLIAAKPAHVVKLGKVGFHVQEHLDLHAAYQHASRVMAENMMRGEAEEGIEAFIAKRLPNWPKN